jgi:serine protease Do
MKRKTGLSVWSVVAVAAVLIAGGMGRVSAAEPEKDPAATLKQTSDAFAALARKAMPAVVFIRVEKSLRMPGRGGGGEPPSFNDPYEFFGEDFFERFFRGAPGPDRRGMPRQPRPFKQMGQGSGFIISKDGYILTNNHVVGDADKITVRMHDGRDFEAKRIGTDPKSEVAVIRIEGNDLPFLPMGDSTAMEIGEWVMAIGNPFGLAETVTTGVVSAKGRSGMGIADYESFIQTDAAINPGNSGGPLLNIKGEAIGINTAIFSRSGGSMGIGFAVPINMARDIKDQLVKTGKVTRGYLGIYIQDLNQELAESFGLKSAEGILVSDVNADSPAEKAGVKQGDVILELNGRKVSNVGEFRNTVASNPPGTELKLLVSRDGKKIELAAKSGELSGDAESGEQAAESADKLGLTVKDVTPDLARQYGLEAKEGAIVTEVAPDGVAAAAGIRAGHVIVSANRQKVANAKEFAEAVAAVGKKGRLLLQVREEKGTRYLVLKLE